MLCDPADVELEPEPTSRNPRPDVELETKTVSSYVRETVETLGEPHRTFLKKSFFEDKSMSQIASEQKCSKSWVCRIRREAIQMLRRRLDAEAVRD